MLIQNFTQEEDTVVKHKCIYRASANETVSNKEVNLFCSMEYYKNAQVAHSLYANILSQNSPMTRIHSLPGVGDEAFYHTDKENFYLVLFRKNNILFRLKINKLTRQASVEELMKIVQQTAASL